MASIVWNDVLALAPELSTVTAGAQTDILAHVNTALAVDVWGGEAGASTRLGRIYLAAHFGTISLQGGTGAAGPVVSESAGELSRSYAWSVQQGGTDSLESTAYGKLYKAMVQRLPKARAPILI